MFVEEASYDILILTLPCKEKELKVDAYAFVFDAEKTPITIMTAKMESLVILRRCKRCMNF